MIPLGLLVILIYVLISRGLPVFSSVKTIEVILISGWHIKAEKQQLLSYKSDSPDLPEYQPLPGAPADMNVYHFGCSGCDHIFVESDPNRALQFYWSELSATDRSSLLARLGYPADAEFTRLLNGPFPKAPWAYQHGYLPSPPNPSFNPDAASASHRPILPRRYGSAG